MFYIWRKQTKTLLQSGMFDSTFHPAGDKSGQQGQQDAVPEVQFSVFYLFRCKHNFDFTGVS